MRVLTMVFAIAAAGCGKTGPLQPPAPRGPYPAASVEARQIGDRVEIALTVPEARGTEPSQAVQTSEILRVAYPPGRPAPSEPDAFRVRGEIVAALDAEYGKPGDRVAIADPSLAALADGGVGWTLRYGVRVRDKRGRPSAIVVARDVTTVPSVAAPTGLRGQASADGVHLYWQAPEGVAEATYNVYRGLGGGPLAEDPLNVLPSISPDYLDASVEAGKTYRYVVRTVAAAGPPYRESSSSNPAIVDASDRFPPAAPERLVAVQEGSGVRLLWNPGAEKDLEGYRVYRATGDDVFQRIGAETVPQPSYLDPGVPPGTRVRYRVTAVDRAVPPNESGPSSEVELRVAAEPATAPETP